MAPPLRRLLIAAAIAGAALAGGTARAQGSFLREPDFRVATIGYRIATAGGALCRERAPLSGMLLHHLAEYARADRPRLIAQGLDHGPGVLAVVADGPAEAAGLRAGDVLLAVDGERFASPAGIAANRDRRQWRPLVEASEAVLEARLARGPAWLEVLRGGETLAVTLVPRAGCPLRIRLANSSQRTAVSSGNHVVLASGILALIRNDDELAFVIAHELAHIALNHRAQLRAQGVPRRGLLRGVGRHGAFVRQTEAEADLLGGELAIAAGYDLARGAEILARLPGELPTLGLIQTHAGTGERIRALRALAARAGTPER
ncbi:MAG: M48 family metallopeptidase [Sphingomonas sp.]